MSKLIVTGCGTDVGKTLVCAVLSIALEADYWKPIECGQEKDSSLMNTLTNGYIFPSTYSFSASLSPHHAARLENSPIDGKKIQIPHTNHPLVMETAGGLLVPLNNTSLNIDLFQQWPATWVVVSRHYLGSINHTLLTLEVMKSRSIAPAVLVFNGEENPDTEEAILHRFPIPCVLRMPHLLNIHFQTLQEVAHSWNPHLVSGTLIHK